MLVSKIGKSDIFIKKEGDSVLLIPINNLHELRIGEQLEYRAGKNQERIEGTVVVEKLPRGSETHVRLIAIHHYQGKMAQFTVNKKIATAAGELYRLN